MDCAQGGELYRLLDTFGALSEQMARFYLGSVVLALQHMHMLEYVYRDLKVCPSLLQLHSRPDPYRAHALARSASTARERHA